jgi:vitamin B12 transporter
MLRLVLLLSFVLLQGELRSQELPNDSIPVVPLREVVVTATRSPIPRADAPATVSSLDSAAIRNANGMTLAGLLTSSSSFFLRENGGGASISTLSVRGGASEHVLVLVNGQRYSSFQNGLADLNLLPLANVDRVEVVSGGSSALYGADALSGVVNVMTKQPSGKTHVRAQAGSGSFDRSNYLLEGESALGGIGLLAGYSTERGRDNYSFTYGNAPGTEATREGADFHRELLYLEGAADLGDVSHLRISAQDVSADRGSPGPYAPSAIADARLFDNIVTTRAEFASSGSSSLTWNLATSYQYNYETYRDPDPLFPYETFYKNLSLSINPQIGWQFSAGQHLMAGAEYVDATLESPDFDSKISRQQKALYATHTLQIESEREYLDRFAVYTSVRFDDISDVGNAFTPKIGVNIRLLRDGDLRLRSSVGKNFRAPSFNDLYYRYFGNPDLKPEHSVSFDAGLAGTARLGGTHTAELSYFQMNTEDRILFDATAGLPVNIGKVKSTGLEAKYAYSPFDGVLTAGLSYTLTNARKMNADSTGDPSYEKQLIYVPKDVVNVSLSVGRERWSVTAAYLYTGERFTSADNTLSLTAYRIVNVSAVVRTAMGGVTWQVKGEVANLFDTDYEVFSGYPMPGRAFNVTLGVEY